MFLRQLSSERDIFEMTALAHRLAAGTLHVIDLPYRLSSWALDDPDNIGLWFDGGQRLVAWAVLQTPFWTVDVVCDPGVDNHLYSEILDWADRRARTILNTPYGHPAWFINIFSGQADCKRDLEAAGFSCQADVGEDSWSKVLMQRSTPAPVKVFQPPAGFSVLPLAGAAEVDAYVDLHRSVFESKNMTVDWRARTLKHPACQPDLDIMVASPTGQLAAFCIGWFDEMTGCGQIEPLGCRADFRRYALGRVALSETLRRLQAKGAKSIFVETDSYRNTAFQLYESFDFQVIQDVLVYRKDYGSK